MLGVYASLLVLLGASLVVGQAVFVLCGQRRWSRLAAAVGLAVLSTVAWWAVRLPGEGTAALIALALVTAAACVVVAGRVEGYRDAIRVGVPVELLAVLLASLPFLVEMRFGILGTGLNPDMSQHLFAVDRLAAGGSERLISEGYPLGPHSLVVALTALGPSPVQAFGGLTIAIAVAACLAPLTMLRRLSAPRQIAGALLVGFAYMTASYLIQGSFKETLQALYVLAFAIGLGELAAGRVRAAGRWGGEARAVPLALIAAGSVYAYSFPGLLWLGGAAAVWGLVELALAARRRGRDAARRVARAAVRPTVVALAVGLLLIAPELGRIADFAGFETFDPAGAGLGNLFDPISPAQALGIWPSGDFRLDPGEGAAPAIVYWLGAALGSAALGFGLWWSWRREERALPCALVAAALLYLYALVAGTPYQEAKAIALAAPLAMLIAVRALLETAPTFGAADRTVRRRGIAELFPRTARMRRIQLAIGALALAFCGAAGVSTLAALVNGPVGPSSYSPALAEIRPLPGSTLVLVPSERLENEHLRDYFVWELRGGKVCVGAAEDPPPATGISQVVTAGLAEDPPLPGLHETRRLGSYRLYLADDPPPGASGCPFIADGARADPGSG
jgi:hypothetical protein